MCRILDVDITDVTKEQAGELLDEMAGIYDGTAKCVFFVNAHTLNLAAEDGDYCEILNSADHVFGDGTGVRWAAKINGEPVKDNVNGTDLIPEFLGRRDGKKLRCYFLGADVPTVRKAAEYAENRFPAAEAAGFHHGYIKGDEASAAVVEMINATRPDVLLVGMGNPLQERWIYAHRHELKVPLIVGVGGLFDFWAGNFSRAPLWLRKLGHEWIWRLLQQPAGKGRRYLLGNPMFLWRVLRRRFSIPLALLPPLPSRQPRLAARVSRWHRGRRHSKRGSKHCPPS